MVDSHTRCPLKRKKKKKKGNGHARQIGAIRTRTISGHSPEDQLRKIQFLVALSLDAHSYAPIYRPKSRIVGKLTVARLQSFLCLPARQRKFADQSSDFIKLLQQSAIANIVLEFKVRTHSVYKIISVSFYARLFSQSSQSRIFYRLSQRSKEKNKISFLKNMTVMNLTINVFSTNSLME